MNLRPVIRTPVTLYVVKFEVFICKVELQLNLFVPQCFKVLLRLLFPTFGSRVLGNAIRLTIVEQSQTNINLQTV